MREIKFRAWDKTRNIYGEVLLIERPYADTDINFMGHAGRVSLFNFKNETDCGFWGVWIEKVDLEQYTGLKDKNGKEIYEGDIMKHPDFRLNASVSFEDGCYCVGGWDCIRTKFEVGEVIGNIYENPELLNA